MIPVRTDTTAHLPDSGDQRMSDYPIRGGRFEAAARALIEAGFLLPWLDRFPVSGSIQPMPQGAVSASQIGGGELTDARGEEPAAAPATDAERATDGENTDREDAVWKCLSTPLVNIIPSQV